MDAHQLERAAYIAAHMILTVQDSAHELACPGARRSREVDLIAGVIKGVFELHLEALARPACTPRSGMRIVPKTADSRNRSMRLVPASEGQT
jgi:hypothetical protein